MTLGLVAMSHELLVCLCLKSTSLKQFESGAAAREGDVFTARCRQAVLRALQKGTVWVGCAQEHKV